MYSVISWLFVGAVLCAFALVAFVLDDVVSPLKDYLFKRFST